MRPPLPANRRNRSRRTARAFAPGITENELWSLLHRAVIRANGDYIETRLLSSGARTNPWMQESSDKKIAAGELVGLDTDIVGPFGYYADFSRTFFCGKGRPTKRQRELHGWRASRLSATSESCAPE